MFKYANVWLMSASPFHDSAERTDDGYSPRVGGEPTWEMQMLGNHVDHEEEKPAFGWT